MRNLLKEILELADGGRDAAFCRLVETRGSTPQKAGATMLVYPDGSQAGTLGGGCVEAEVKRKALLIMEDTASQIESFQLNSDYGWDDGLICGGRMQILVTPVNNASAREYCGHIVQLLEQERGFTEAVVFDEASDFELADRVLLDSQQQFVASTSGGTTDSCDATFLRTIQDHSKPIVDRPRAYAQSGIAFLPSLERCRLVIVGGGHVGKAVADLAYDLDFNVWVVDDRDTIVSEDRFPRAEQRLVGGVDEILPDLPIDSNTYCLIVTRGHNHDEEALYHLAERGARYVGLIGSTRKIKMIYDDMLEEGVSSDALQNVFAPLGIDIGSQTVPEIAVSICAELVSHRNQSGYVPGRPEPIRVSAKPESLQQQD